MGLVGSATFNHLKKNGYKNIIIRDRHELDLIDQSQTIKFFENEKPEVVICAAAKVGGIYANSIYSGQFLYENLAIQNNIIHFSHQFRVQKLIFLGSACIYPKHARQPIKEQLLLSGYLEPTNEAYAIAKIAGIKLCENYFKQYSDNFLSIMPNNLYGPNDNFHPDNAHVIPALIQKFHSAKVNFLDKVTLWGTGKPFREFLHVYDLAEAIIFILENISAEEIFSKGISHINIGSGEELSIDQLATLIKNVIKYDGEIHFDNNKPDGTPRKLLDTSFLKSKGWAPKIKLEKGIKDLYEDYLKSDAIA